jgi:dGTPase
MAVINFGTSQKVIGMVEPYGKAMLDLRDFLFEAVYNNPLAKSEEEKVSRMINYLFEYYFKHMDELPKEIPHQP